MWEEKSEFKSAYGQRGEMKEAEGENRFELTG